MQLGHLLTRSGLTYPEFSLMLSPRFFCLSFCRFLVQSVIYYDAFSLYVATNFFVFLCFAQNCRYINQYCNIYNLNFPERYFPSGFIMKLL
jgi:hypothetical protein